MKNLLILLLCITLVSCKNNQFDNSFSHLDLNKFNNNYLYNQLSENEKVIYCLIDENVDSLNSRFNIPESSVNEVIKVLKLYGYINTGLYFYSLENIKYFLNNSTNSVFEIEFNFERDEETDLIIDNTISSFIDTIKPLGDYDKAFLIHNYLCDLITYNKESDYNQDIRSVFLNHESVCAGYAKSFNYICSLVDLESYYVTGYSINDDKKENHAWNMVNIDGDYYWIDITFDDATSTKDENISSYDYFLLTDEHFLYNHLIDDFDDTFDFDYPECNTRELDYYYSNWPCYESFDKEQIKNDINYLFRDKDLITITFVNDSDYKEAVSYLIGNDDNPNYLELVRGNTFKYYGLFTYWHKTNDNIKSISLFITRE